jgi:RHS repeat-associated protein
VISYEEFHPYGSTAFQGGRSVAEVSLKRYRFTGMERDEGTGFNYHGARYYAVWLGRWTSTDPAGITAGLNFYAYADDSPVSLVDPTGREPLTFEITDEQRLEALKHGQKIDPRQKTQTLRLLQKPKAKKAKKTGGVAGGEAGGVVGGDVGGKRGDQPHHGQDDQPKSDAPSQPGGDGPPKDPKDTGSGGDGEPGEGGTGSGAETKPGSPEGGSGKDQAEQGTGSGGGSGTGEGSGAKKKDGWLNLPDWVRTLLIVGLVVTAFLSVATFIRAVVTGFRVGGMLGATQAAATSTTATVTAVGGGGGATALIQNAPSVESILFSYRDQAVAHAQTTIDPNLPARRVPTSFGNLADARMKQLVQADIDSGALPSTFRVTANFQYGPDVFDTATGIGYDLTTATNLQVFKHDDKYIGSTVVFDGISYVVNDVLPLVYNR